MWLEPGLDESEGVGPPADDVMIWPDYDDDEDNDDDDDDDGNDGD